MKIILFAYRNCGYECLNYLIGINKKPSLVVIPKAEDQKERIFKSVRNLAITSNVNFLEVEKDSPDLKKEIASIKPDYGFSCYFPYIIRPEILNLFDKGTFNIHGAILPDYRGALSPVWTIINDEVKSGATIHQMTESIDCGDIIESISCDVDEKETGFSLYQKISKLSVSLFIKYFHFALEGKEISGASQLPDTGNYYSRDIPFDGRIDWSWGSRKIYNFCRAMYFPPFKSAIFFFNGSEFEVDSLEITSKKSDKKAGELVSIDQSGITLATVDFDIFIDSQSIDMKQFRSSTTKIQTN